MKRKNNKESLYLNIFLIFTDGENEMISFDLLLCDSHSFSLLSGLLCILLVHEAEWKWFNHFWDGDFQLNLQDIVRNPYFLQ